MNGFDLVTTGVTLVSLLVGLAIGAARMALGLVAVVTGMLVSMALGPRLALVIEPSLGSPSAAAITGFVLVYAGVLAAFGLIAWLVRHSLRQLGLGWFDRAAGALVASVAGVTALALATAAAGDGLEGRTFVAQSVSFSALRAGGEQLLRRIPIERVPLPIDAPPVPARPSPPPASPTPAPVGVTPSSTEAAETGP